ncbi:MAG: response regulator [Anaerolineales bacterium]|jgi:YesN/AraC family two-component response regulator
MMDQPQKRTPYRVLIADDVLETRRNTRLMLADNPMVDIVAIAHNGREAVELAKKHQPDIALMDINMPEMNGFEAFQAMYDIFPSMACVIISAEDDNQSFRSAMNVGAREYLVKPFTVYQLNNAIKRVGDIVKAERDKAEVADRLRQQRASYLLQLAQEYSRSRRTDDEAVEVFEQLAANPKCELRWLRTLAMLYIIRQEWKKLQVLAGRLARQFG